MSGSFEDALPPYAVNPVHSVPNPQDPIRLTDDDEISLITPFEPVLSQPSPQVDAEKSEKLWAQYLAKTDKTDKILVENWKGDTDSILIFTGLFSATVAAFVVESYKSLIPDPSNEIIALLSQIASPSNNGSSGLIVPFSAPASSVRANIMWFSSLCLSLTCALGATLVQQWVRSYTQATQDFQTSVAHRGRARAFMFYGVNRFQMAEIVHGMPLILHISVFLFFGGLFEFLRPINTVVAYTTLAIISFAGCVYAGFTALPIFYSNSPFQTPLSPLVWRAASLPASALDIILRTFSQDRLSFAVSRIRKRYSFSMGSYWMRHRFSRCIDRADVVALKHIATDVYDQAERVTFLDNLASFLRPHFSRSAYREMRRIGHTFHVDPRTVEDLWSSPIATDFVPEAYDLAESRFDDSENSANALGLGEVCMRALWSMAICSPFPPSNGPSPLLPLAHRLSLRDIGSWGLLKSLTTSDDAMTSVTAHVMLAHIAADLQLSSRDKIFRVLSFIYGKNVDPDHAYCLHDCPFIIVSGMLEGVLPVLKQDRHVERLLHPAIQLCIEKMPLMHYAPLSGSVRTTFNGIYEELSRLEDRAQKALDVTENASYDADILQLAPLDPFIPPDADVYRRLINRVSPLQNLLTRRLLSV